MKRENRSLPSIGRADPSVFSSLMDISMQMISTFRLEQHYNSIKCRVDFRANGMCQHVSYLFIWPAEKPLFVRLSAREGNRKEGRKLAERKRRQQKSVIIIFASTQLGGGGQRINRREEESNG